MYHELERKGTPLCSLEPGYVRYVVKVETFRDQLQWLSAEGFRADCIGGVLAQPSTQPMIIVTFDDGTASDLEIAAPELMRHGFNATFFVTTGFLGRRGYLTKPQVRALADQGFEIGSHGATHRYLTELDAAEAQIELSNSKTLLEQITGRPVRHVSAPGGRWDRRIARLAREAGFATFATSDIGLTDLTQPTLRRLAVMRQTTDRQFQDMCLGRHLTGPRLRARGLRLAKRFLGNARYEAIRARFLGPPAGR